jgi:hypothetical protein
MGCPIVSVVNRSSRHYGKKVEILFQTPKMYFVRDTVKRPTHQRFGYDSKGKVSSTNSMYESFYISKSSVQTPKSEIRCNDLNNWQTETGRLLKQNIGLSKADIRAKYVK